MKKLFMILFIVLISTNVATLANTKISNENINVENVDFEELILKQTLLFEDNSSVVIYYVKQSGVYRVYSETDLKHQNPKRLLSLKSYKINKVNDYKGKCYVECLNLKQVIDLGINLYTKYKNYIKI